MKTRILFVAPDLALYETAKEIVRRRHWEDFVQIEEGCDGAGLAVVRNHHRQANDHFGIISRGGTASLIQHWNNDLLVEDVGYDPSLVLLEFQTLNRQYPGKVAISCVESMLPSPSTIAEAVDRKFIDRPLMIDQPKPGDPESMEESLCEQLHSFAQQGGQYLICDNHVDQLALKANLSPIVMRTPSRLVEETIERMLERLGKIFVIMSFHTHHSEDPTFTKGIKPALKDHGFDAFRMDEDKTLERINPRIEEEIRKSPFIVADLSYERPNTYYELGFARGLKKPVITIARKGAPIHFDVSDLPRIDYTDHSDLRTNLSRLVGDTIA